MNKNELVSKVAINACISNSAAQRAINALTDAITQTLAKGGKVPLIGLATFDTVIHQSYTVRNPRTGQPVVVPQKRMPRVRFSATLKNSD